MLRIHKYTLGGSWRTVQVEFLLTQVLCVCGLRTWAMAASQSNVRQSEERAGRRRGGPGLVRLCQPHSLTQLLRMRGGLPPSRPVHRLNLPTITSTGAWSPCSCTSTFPAVAFSCCFFFLLLLLLCSPSLVFFLSVSFSLFFPLSPSLFTCFYSEVH